MRLRLATLACLVIAVLAIGLSQMKPADASDSAQGIPINDVSEETLTTPQLIDLALQRGEITKDERLLLLTYAIYRPALLPEKYQSNVGWYGTQYVLELQQSRSLLVPQQSPAAAEVIAILTGAVSIYCDASDGPNTTDSTYFRISYGTIGGGLTINDYKTSLDTTYQIEVTNYGWAAPPYAAANTFNKYPVQVANLGSGLYGYVTTGGGNYTEFIGDNPNTPETETDSIASCMVLNNDFSQFPEGAQGALDSTTSHEYVHAIQNGYGDPSPREDSMWYESVAAYMEDEIFDSANSDYQYLWPEVSNCLGEWPNNSAPGGVSQYSNFTFFRHIAEHNGGTNQPGGGEDIAQTLWKNIGAGQSGLDAYNNALATEGTDSTNLNDAFHKYAIAIKNSKPCGAGYAAPYCFEEGADYASYVGSVIGVDGTINAVPGSTNGSVRNNYAANYVSLPSTGTYKVSLQNTSGGGQMRGSVVCDTGTSYNITAFPSVAGTGQTTVIDPFNATGCASVFVAITNQQKTSSDPASCSAQNYQVSVDAPSANTPTATWTSTPQTPTTTPTPTATWTNTPVGPTSTSTSTPVVPTSTATATATGTSAAPTATPTATSTAPASANLLQNSGFEQGIAPWIFYTTGKGTFTTEGPGYEGDYAARVDITKKGDNVQLYQTGFLLENKAYYRLSFAGRSSNGHDVSLYVHQHKSPFTTYGLRNFRINLTTTWNEFSVDFRAKNINKKTNDTRVRLWFKPFIANGDTYWFDNITLVKLNSVNRVSNQFGEIAGVVQAGGANSTVILVDLETEGANFTSLAQTNADGTYHFSSVPYGNYEIRVEAPQGYLAPEPVQLLISDQANESQDFALDEITDTLYLPLIAR